LIEKSKAVRLAIEKASFLSKEIPFSRVIKAMKKIIIEVKI
jgi:hypothetical protein